MNGVYKIKSNLNPAIIKAIFIDCNISYNLRQGNDSVVETVSFFGNTVWWSLPNVVNETNSLSTFKAQI